jgi:hypothetical protein
MSRVSDPAVKEIGALRDACYPAELVKECALVALAAGEQASGGSHPVIL